MSPLTLGRFDGISVHIDWDKLSALSNVMLGNLPRLIGCKNLSVTEIYTRFNILRFFFNFFFSYTHIFDTLHLQFGKNKHHFVASVNTFFFLNKNITKL